MHDHEHRPRVCIWDLELKSGFLLAHDASQHRAHWLSMSRPSLSTPCPAPSDSLFGARTLSTMSAQDDTADLEYTRAIPHEIHNARPRRRSTFQRRERKDAPMTIFEDVVEDQELVIAEPKKEIGGRTLLGQAARKMPRSSTARPQEAIKEEMPTENEARSRTRGSTLVDSIPGLRFKMAEPVKDVALEAKPQGGLKKDPRRRTIFVPSDDTTMLTIHPGANATDRLNDTFQLPDLGGPVPFVGNEPAAHDKPSPKPAARRSRMSLAVAPKRLPLQQMATEKGNIPGVDVAGQNGGKENLPPRSLASVTGDRKPSPRLFAPTAASQARGSIQARKAALPPSNLRRTQFTATRSMAPARTGAQDIWQSQPGLSTQRSAAQQKPAAPSQPQRLKPASARTSTVRPISSTPSTLQQPQPATKKVQPVPAKRSSPPQRSDFAIFKANKLKQYPVLSGDLAQPDLYEEDWLQHQEIALAEVINQLFNDTNRTVDRWCQPDMSLRERLVEIYHQPHVSTLHQRLQASLQFGALSLPRGTSPTTLSQDIGLRRRFMNTWLETYDEKLLRDAAEVVVGRQIPETRSSAGHQSIESAFDPHHGRRRLVSFFETFFVEAQDARSGEDSSEACWRKTVARSLMLIWLLDQAKTSHAVSACLFKASSPRRSSAKVLDELATIVLPSSVGDTTRALGHCDYAVSHYQDPLDEVTYRIENMASDMRDGIFLCRLVELLLFPRMQNQLSQHLKMPCLGRTQKLFNVEVALSALTEHGGLREAASRLTAEDIVNGHREKTLSLLWSLVSTYGLEALLDFRELMRDIQKNSEPGLELPLDQEYLAQHQQEELLQAWATAICAKRGIEIMNFTTSFADGCAYAAIVESFGPFCAPPKENVNAYREASTSTTAILRALSTSAAFTASLTSTTHTISARQTTISNLAFLAARLLPLKRRHNAAATIQRAYRHRRSRVVAAQRVKLKRLAHACATVVQTRNRLVDAATVLQRAWRAVIEKRLRRLNADVEGFQVLARGWVVRRELGIGTGGRAIGGW